MADSTGAIASGFGGIPLTPDMHPELLALMKRFELCYELRDSVPPTWLAPQLLPPAKPKELADWGAAEDLVLRYHYEFLPKWIDQPFDGEAAPDS